MPVSILAARLSVGSSRLEDQLINPCSLSRLGPRCLSSRHRYPHIRGFRSVSTSDSKRAKLAFAFDIDGVLLRGSEVLPEGQHTLRYLNGENELGIKIPYIFMTNGGGISESKRCQKLSAQLGIPVRPSHLIQAHTVLKSPAFVSRLKDKRVLVLGGKGDEVRSVAEEYGFKDVVTTFDIHAWNHTIWPLHEPTVLERSHAQSFSPSIPISAILTFHDPRNWALDVQICVDLMQSGGYVGDAAKHFRRLRKVKSLQNPSNDTAESDSEAKVELVFCNPDLVWGSEFPIERIGQGGFRVALLSVYNALTGSDYPYVQLGKPTELTYDFATQVLKERVKDVNKENNYSGERAEEIDHIYMIGDNPASDIAGANAAGWRSILVETGVYSSSRGPPAHFPTRIAKNVLEGVKWAVENEYKSL